MDPQTYHHLGCGSWVLLGRDKECDDALQDLPLYPLVSYQLFYHTAQEGTRPGCSLTDLHLSLLVWLKGE